MEEAFILHEENYLRRIVPAMLFTADGKWKYDVRLDHRGMIEDDRGGLGALEHMGDSKVWIT